MHVHARRKDDRMQLCVPIERRQSGHFPQAGPDDHAIALALTTVWAIRTGRRLRPVPVSELSEQELVAFWADDQIGEDRE
jgi:hypothetical protein